MTGRTRAPGRVLYAGFGTPRHSGGGHVLTQHVALLRDTGRDARLWLPDPANRPDWIDRDVPIVFGAETEVGSDDVLVLPEVPVVPGLDPAPGARKVIFNQNHFYTYAAAPDGRPYPGWSPTPAVWTVSAESRDVLRALLPDAVVMLVPNLIDGDLFVPASRKAAQVTWFPRKRPREASILRRLAAADARLTGIEVTELVDAERRVVASTLATTSVFVALGHSESFGLPVAEALAAGCLVVGYDGGGGHELFDAPGAWRVPEQRPLLLLDRVAELLAHADECGPLRTANRAWVLQRHSAAGASTALTSALEAAEAGPGAVSTATHPAAWLDRLGPGFTAYA